MKKTIIGFAIGFVFSVNINAQKSKEIITYDVPMESFPPAYVNISKYDIIDSAYLKCTYNLTYLKDSSKVEKKSTDVQTLLIGKNISKYYSQYKLDHYKFAEEYLKTHESYPYNREEGTWSKEFYKNYPENKATIADIGSMLRDNFIYEEELPKFKWKLSNEKQTVLSYQCHMATVNYRGRDYIAWYTKEIPVSNGPWKFTGLPGLILKVYDTKNQYVFECKGLEQLKPKEPIKFYKVDYIKTSGKELDKLYKRIHYDYAHYMRTNYEVTIEEYRSGKFIEVQHSSARVPYNPIELE